MLGDVIQAKRISSKIDVITNFKGKKQLIYAPEQQLKQVFFVIIQNAIDALEGEGALSIMINEDQKSSPEFVEVVISDTGSGIPDNERPKIFEPKISKYTENEPFSSGIGLVWARSFMRSFNGDISYETEFGKGTAMHIKLAKDFREQIKK